MYSPLHKAFLVTEKIESGIWAAGFSQTAEPGSYVRPAISPIRKSLRVLSPPIPLTSMPGRITIEKDVPGSRQQSVREEFSLSIRNDLVRFAALRRTMGY